ncbi:MAG: methyl-accepting chemotaxis protein [Candidatus Aureabacteria bacterium]|nr:methyl-accepting chemotaxis protein [Candidatus Auribacterota bacterium]
MSTAEKNKRRLFLNKKFQAFFGFYAVVTVFIAIFVMSAEYIRMFVSVFLTHADQFDLDMPLKMMIFLGWLLFTYLIFYAYYNARMLGVFKRITDVCERIIRGENIRLAFRTEDSFGFVAEKFNELVDDFKEREEKFSKTIIKAKSSLEAVLSDKKDVQEEIQKIIKEIEKVNIDENIIKKNSNPDSC